MKHEHLVEICAHRIDETRTIGTGYPVAPGRILTAKHVVSPEQGNGEMEVRWCNLQGTSGAARPAKVVWMGDVDVDAAVIECEFPPEITAVPNLLSDALPAYGEKWVSAAFVQTRKKDGPPMALGGDVYPMTDRTGTFDLGADHVTQQTERWDGVSGCPVFVRDRILGVIVNAPSPSEPRLRATAIAPLLEDERFREAIRYPVKWKALQAYRGQLVRVFSESREAVQHLAADLELDARDSPMDLPALSSRLVDHLLGQTLDNLLPLLSLAQEDLYERKSPAAVDVLWHAARMLMPAVGRVAAIDAGRWGVSDHTLVILPAATQTLAEIILAAADGRPTLFALADPERPEPLLRIPCLPGGGEDAGVARFEEEWHKYVIKKFVIDVSLKTTRTHNELIRIASNQLSNLLKYHKRRYYYIVEARPEAMKEWNPLLERLREHYPAVAFVTLMQSDSDLEREDTLRFHIADMLERVQRGGTP